MLTRTTTPLARREPAPLTVGAERRSLAFGLDFTVSLGGICHVMKREREMKRERDELDSLAAEAGHSADLVGMTALILVMALVLGFVI